MRSYLIHGHCIIVGIIGHLVTHLDGMIYHNQSLNCNLYEHFLVRDLTSVGDSFLKEKGVRPEPAF